MFDSILNNPNGQMLERTLNYTEQRHQLILSDVANLSTPGYVSKDVPAAEFQDAMSKALEKRRRSGYLGSASNRSVTLGSHGEVSLKPRALGDSTAFHDRSARNPEQLMSNLADNAHAHNVTAQLLRMTYSRLDSAIKMRA